MKAPFRKGDVIRLVSAHMRPELEGSVWVVLFCKRSKHDDWEDGRVRIKSFDPRWWDDRVEDKSQWTTYRQAHRFEKVKP